MTDVLKVYQDEDGTWPDLPTPEPRRVIWIRWGGGAFPPKARVGDVITVRGVADAVDVAAWDALAAIDQIKEAIAADDFFHECQECAFHDVLEPILAGVRGASEVGNG